MKRLTTLFTFLLFATMAFSQIPVTVSGTITDLDGNPVGDIEVHIYVDTTSAGFTYSSIVTTSADGTYSDTFDAPDADTQGGVSAWIPDCNQSQLFQMGYWSPGGGPVIDFVYCNICSASISEFGNNNLQVTATGEAPFAYVWSDGSTTETITPVVAGNYCVTATDNNGCLSNACYYYASDSCFVFIDGLTPGELTAFPGGIAPFSYYWGTGETTPTISIPGAGEYCLSIVDAVGCVTSDCIIISGCNLNVSISGPGDVLSASVQGGNAAISYAWSTGEVTQSIVVTTIGEYCVTATDAQGCTDNECYYFGPFLDSCYVLLEEVQNGAWLYADVTGLAPFTYLWNTGETTASIEMTEEIEYCVTVTTSWAGCESSSCFDNTPEPFLVHGYVHPYDSLTTEYIDGIAELYTIDGDIVTYVTSTEIDSNYYDFGEVTPGDYLTKAIVDEYLPTYHFVAEFWDEADIVSADAPLWWGYDISLLPLDDEFVNDGPALISGTVNGGISSEIILYNNNGSALAYIITNADGTYSFEGLPYGTYTVYIEIPGYEQEFYTITLSPDNETVENADFNVDANQHTITTGSREVLLSNIVLSVFPNPTKSALTVNLDMNTKGNAVIQIVNSIGQEVLNDTFEQNKMLNVSTLSTGVYLIKVTTQEGIAVKQFIKE